MPAPHARAALALPAVVAALVAAPATAHATPVEVAAGHAAKATVSAPGEVTEGDRFTVTVKVPRGASRVLLQHQETDALGYTSWKIVKRSKPGRKVSYPAVAGERDTEAFRARVIFPAGHATMSRPSRTTVWHWYDLTSFAEYDDSSGTISGGSFPMNGQQYRGWSTYIGYPSYQTGWTVGRHCRALRADVGVTDGSKPGSSATIQIVADGTTTSFTSGPLSPGMVQPIAVDLATPYRLEVHAQDTSPDKVQAYPALGDPELLCTGLD